MYIHSVKLVNFKSIGETDNEIILEPRITTMIGKNESGKSNALEGLSNISLIGDMSSAFLQENINRSNGISNEIEYHIVLKSNEEELKSKQFITDTKIIISKDSCLATGGILEYYNNNIRQYINTLIENFGENPFKLNGNDYTNYHSNILILQKEDSLDIRGINKVFVYLSSHFKKNQVKGKALQSYSRLKLEWNSTLALLPTIFYRNSDKILKTQYKIDEVKKELSSPNAYPNSLLSDFIKLIKISKEDFIMAVESGTSGPKITIRERINKNIEKKINEKFKYFYTTESISLNVRIDSNTVCFSVQSGEGETLLLSERSNGLRWYLNTFIDAQANGIEQNNVIYLFDEPGISLHVNAQRELLNLFEDLANKGNQIVYTTHSPYMLNLDEGGIHRIRAIEKDDQGYTHVYKTAYDARLSHQNKQDTLAPIIYAIGMTLQDTFGPTKDKLNVVTEGVSDYIYLQTMAKILEIDMTKINIIPSCGVSNCLSLCNILLGWNCNFIAIFDYDKEGVESGGEKMSKNFQYDMRKPYIYLKDVEQKSIQEKDYNNYPYMIEDLVGRDILEDFIKEKKLLEDSATKNKTLLSKLFCTAVESGEHVADTECLKRFKNLFDRIFVAAMQIN